jgi:hypothetical protein
MRIPTSSNMLLVWERGIGLHPLDQGLLFLSAAFPELPSDTFADWPLGLRNSTLAEYHYSIFGAELEGSVTCPECGEKLEFQIDARSLIARSERQPAGDCIEVHGHRFRLPTSRDLIHVADEADPAVGARRLLEVCHLDADEATNWSEEDIEEIGERMAAADPLAETRLVLRCQTCSHEWNENFDIAQFLWAEVDAAAKRLLREVHTLASAYGWTEAEILALSDTRRTSYLGMVRD